MQAAYLMAVHAETDVSTHREDGAVLALMERGLLGRDFKLTDRGACAARIGFEKIRSAMALYETPKDEPQ